MGSECLFERLCFGRYICSNPLTNCAGTQTGLSGSETEARSQPTPLVRRLGGQHANECDYNLQVHIYAIMEPTVR